MPIKIGVQTKPVSYEDFHAVDYEVMGIVFSIHRELGRLWNEKIYQNELVHRCRRAGFDSITAEVPICVSYEDFVKVYYIDLLINNVIYELKTARTLVGEHEKQTINYLVLTGLNHAKLINMRPPSVQHRFVSTNMTREERYDLTVDDEHWLDLDDNSAWLKRMFNRLLQEWGAFLEVSLFYDAIVHFRGGEENAVREIDVRDGSRLMGRQKTHLITPNVAFMISSVTKDVRHYENHLRRFVRYTSLKAIQWINFNHQNVVFKTILK
jgi:GxxExxY protein